MTLFLGFSRETELEQEVEDLGCGAGRTACPECEGTGDWTRFHPEPESLDGPLACVDCKGTGYILVSI